MGKKVLISLQIPEELLHELQMRVPKRERSSFIRDAILEKLSRTPKPDKIIELEARMARLEDSLSSVKKALAELELLTYGAEKIDLHRFCGDSIDRKIIDYLIEHRGATTPELARVVGLDRWKILGRLRKIERRSKQELGKPVVIFDAGEREGKRRAWWLTA